MGHNSEDNGRPDALPYASVNRVRRSWMNPARLAGLGVLVCAVDIVVMSSLGPAVKSDFWMGVQLTLLIAEAVLGSAAVAWAVAIAYRRRDAAFLTKPLAIVLLLFLVWGGVLVPSYWGCLRDIAAVKRWMQTRGVAAASAPAP